jgi:hypothetical protein
VLEERDHTGKRDNTYTVVTATPPTQSNSAGIDQDGTDFSYFAQVQLGSKAKSVYLLLDTGAGTTWVMGPSCTSAPCKTHNSFGAGDSDTFKLLPQSFGISYGSGSVSGDMATDTLSIAGIKLTANFGIANQTTDDFTSFPIDGILGLSQAKGPAPTFMETVVAQKVLKANIFGVSISRSSDGVNNGVINFGAPDSSQFTGSLSYSPVITNSEGDWAIQMDDVGFGDASAGVGSKSAYIDTGTSFIFAPDADCKKFHDIVPGAQSTDGTTYTVPCTTTTPLTITFGSNTYTISPKDWVAPMANGACTSNVYGHEVVEGAWLLGDTYLKNVYTVFDVDQNRVGKGFLHTGGSIIDTETGFAAKPAPSVSSSTITTSTGGPISSSQSSPGTPASSDSVSTTGLRTMAQSNWTPTGFSSGTAATQTSLSTGDATNNAPDSTPTSGPGLNGHQTSGSSASAAAESSTGASATPTSNQSGSVRPHTNLICLALTAICLFAVI